MARINRLTWDAVRGVPNAWADLLSTCVKPGNEHFAGAPQALAWRRCEIARKVTKSGLVSTCSKESGSDPAVKNLTQDVCMGRGLADALGAAALVERLPLDQLGTDGVP
jgi:hypothetical protein